MEESLAARAIRAAGGADAFFKAVGRAQAEAMLAHWPAIARPKQLEPAGDWLTWLIKAGRGFGKTRIGAETCVGWLRSGRAKRMALVAPTAGDARDVMVEGESGILVCSARARFPAHYEPSKRRITWPNGAIATLFSAEEPDRLRGPQHDAAWLDELASWKRDEETFNMLQFGLRLGDLPRKVITTTPRPTKLVRSIIKDPTTKVTSGSTYENQVNLAKAFIEDIRRRFEGTRLGNQEIHAVVLDDNPGALWKLSEIDAHRLRPPEALLVNGWSRIGDASDETDGAGKTDFGRVIASLEGRMRRARAILDAHDIQLQRIVIGVDPAVSDNPSSDEIGIVISGAGPCRCRGGDKAEVHGFTLDDVSGTYSPAEWGALLVKVFQVWHANKVVAEINQGGNLVEANLRAADGGAAIPYDGVHAKQGKRIRAEPVSALHEQGKMHHVSALPKLEDELTQWDPQDLNAKSPNRLDAKVYAETELMIGPVRTVFRGSAVPGSGRRI